MNSVTNTCKQTYEKLDYIPLMRYGIGTLRDNQRDMT